MLPKTIVVKHVHWIEPLPHEPLDAYCRRLLPQINATENFVLVGLSFGGMVAIELSKMLRPRCVIIISTVATCHQFPLQFKAARFLHLTEIVPMALLKIPNRVSFWFFSVKTPSEKALLRSFLKKVSVRYLKWSMKTVLHWKNTYIPENLYHIHGDSDRIFPVAKTQANCVIAGGGHFMVYHQATKISAVLARVILG